MPQLLEIVRQSVSCDAAAELTREGNADVAGGHR